MIEDIIEFEDKFYDHLFEKYNDYLHDKNELQIFLCKTMIKLMDILKEKVKQDFVKNALITLIMLFDNIPPDHYNSIGEDMKDLSIREKKQILFLFESEINIKGAC